MSSNVQYKQLRVFAFYFLHIIKFDVCCASCVDIYMQHDMACEYNK